VRRAALAGCVLVLAGGAAVAAPTSPPPLHAIRTALVQQLRAQHLSFRSVACIPNRRSWRGLAVVRCNVDFGDPHIVAYCAVLVRGRLVTNHRERSLPCRPDTVGDAPTIVSS
jgi:hypothetical protein